MNINIFVDLNQRELSAIATDPDCQHQFFIDAFSEIEYLNAAIEKRACRGNHNVFIISSSIYEGGGEGEGYT